MQIKKLQGLIAAPFTPMDKDGKLNLSIIPNYYKFLKNNGVIGAFICGSTGEGVSLTTAEKKDVAEAWAACSKNDPAFKVITLVGGTCITDCIDLSKHAETQGLYAVAITAPFYFKPSGVDMLAEICKVVAASVPTLPFYYYHIPVLTGVNFPMLELLRCMDGVVPNFAGIKYTHEDFMDFLSCTNFNNGKYDMLWGRDENLLSALIVGAKGGVGSTFNYAAPLYYDLIEAFNKGDFATARNKQQQAIDMISLLGKYGGIATGKAFMKMVDLDCGAFRLPVKNMNEERFEFFKKDIDRIRFSNYCSRH
jgi:N-acetylneuraminate lyase